MTPIRRRLLYIFRGSLLRLRVSLMGQSLTISVGYHVDRERWDGDRCRRNTTHGKQRIPAATINKVLENLERKIDEAFATFELTDQSPTPQQIREAVSPKKTASKTTIASLADTYRSQQSSLRQWSDRTARGNKQALDCLTELFGKLPSLDCIGDKEMIALMDYMTAKRTYVMRHTGQKACTRQGLGNVTINRYLTMIRSFARWAVERGLCSDTALLHRSRELSTADLPVIYLNLDELTRFRTADVSEALREVRDAFVFACFTGLRYSDMLSLTWSQVKDDHIEVVTKKTHDRIDIELNRHSRAILDSRHDRSGCVFRLPSNATYNQYAKKIAKTAGIDTPVRTVSYSGTRRIETVLPKWQHVSSHTPRKTFVVNALSLGISPVVVMKWTGHKNYRAMKPYVDIVSAAKRDGMALLDTLPLPTAPTAPSTAPTAPSTAPTAPISPTSSKKGVPPTSKKGVPPHKKEARHPTKKGQNVTQNVTQNVPHPHN